MIILPPNLNYETMIWVDICSFNKELRCVHRPRIPIPPRTIATYIIRNPHTSEFYVGSGIHILRRMSEHMSALIFEKHGNHKLQASYDNNMHLQVGYFLCDTKDDAFDLEQLLLDLNAENKYLLNLAKNARSSGKGIPMLPHVKEALRQSRIGVPPSEYCLKRIREVNTGRKKTPEEIEKLRASSIGRRHTEEHKQWISNLMKGNKYGLGHRHTAEAKRNISQKQIGKFVSAETRLKQSAARIANAGVSVIVNGVRYNSISEAQKHLQIAPTSFSRMLDNPKYPGYHRVLKNK